MGAAIGSNQSSPVNRKAHRQVLDRDIMHNLIIGALQECRIYSRERTHPLRRESCGKGHAMLFGDPDIKCAIRMGLRKFVYAGARWHSSGNRTDARISVGQLGERFAKNILVSRWSAARSL